jgi:hypothetical protein
MCGGVQEAEGIAFDTQRDLDALMHYLVGRQAQLRMEQGRFRQAETIALDVMSLERFTWSCGFRR